MIDTTNAFRKASSLLIVLASVGAISAAAPASATIPIIVKNWSFSPATVRAHVGRVTNLAFTAQEGVHGVESSEIGLAKTILVPGKTTHVAFTPTKPGSYAVHCAVVCGAGHAKMMFTVQVVK